MFPRRHAILFLVLVVLIASVGLGVAAFAAQDAHAHHGSAVMGCPLMPGGASLCAMNATTHVAHWQSFFVATAAGGTADLLTVFALLVVVFAAATLSALMHRREPIFVFLEHRQHQLLPYISLQHAFARGIVHPKKPLIV